MAPAWQADRYPDEQPISAIGWVRVMFRTVSAAIILIVGLAFLLLLRLVERPLCGTSRPWTPAITMVVCRMVLRVIGLPLEITGKPMKARGAIVANHSTWLDILCLNAHQAVYFVAKSEVAGWAGIGLLAKATGTLFVRRQRSDAKRQKTEFEQRLSAGHHLLFFPEGTSTDGSLVLPFKSTLFAAFFSPDLPDNLQIQPVTVSYTAPPGHGHDFYGWWGAMNLGPHLAKVVSVAPQGRVNLHYHSPIFVRDFAGRKELALACEIAVRQDHPATYPPEC